MNIFYLDSSNHDQLSLRLSDVFIGIVVVSTVVVMITIILTVIVIVLCLKRNVKVHKKPESDNLDNPQVIYEDVQNLNDNQSGTIGIERNEAYISASDGL
jgi:hypothetical protein